MNLDIKKIALSPDIEFGVENYPSSGFFENTQTETLLFVLKENITLAEPVIMGGGTLEHPSYVFMVTRMGVLEALGLLNPNPSEVTNPDKTEQVSTREVVSEEFALKMLAVSLKHSDKLKINKD